MQRSGKIRLFIWIVSRQDWYIIGHFELCIFGRSNELPHWLDCGFWLHLWVLLLRLASFYEHIFPAADMGLDDWRDPTGIFLISRFLHCTSNSRDRKRKRFVGTGGQDSKKKKVKTESGTWIPASYKSNAYPFEKLTKNSNIDIVCISVILWEVKMNSLTPQYPQIVTKMFWI